MGNVTHNDVINQTTSQCIMGLWGTILIYTTKSGIWKQWKWNTETKN